MKFTSSPTSFILMCQNVTLGNCFVLSALIMGGGLDKDITTDIWSCLNYYSHTVLK